MAHKCLTALMVMAACMVRGASSVGQNQQCSTEQCDSALVCDYDTYSCKIAVGRDCSNSVSCTTNTQCTGTAGNNGGTTCECDENNFKRHGDLCKPKDGTLGGDCKANDVCDVPFSSCVNTVCTCTHVTAPSGTACYNTEGALGGQCKTGDVCDTEGAECVSNLCQCEGSANNDNTACNGVVNRGCVGGFTGTCYHALVCEEGICKLKVGADCTLGDLEKCTSHSVCGGTDGNNGGPTCECDTKTFDLEGNLCRLREPPVQGHWLEWGDWGTCSLSPSGSWRQTRTRACSEAHPRRGSSTSSACAGSHSANRSCEQPQIVRTRKSYAAMVTYSSEILSACVILASMFI